MPKPATWVALGSANITYSPNGELIEDGVRFTYKYDAWGRMVSVSTRGGSPVVVSNYRYNGLGFRIGWQYHQAANAGGPGIVNADPWFWLVYNDK